MERGRHVILIGMPGCGKSTLGVVLAKVLGYDFIDTDLVIQRVYESTLPDLIREHGREGFLDMECAAVSSISPDRPGVIATGGSVVYRDGAMRRLRALGTVIYLRVSAGALAGRLHGLETRGVVMPEGMTLADLYRERSPLYERYADLTLDEDGDDMGKVLERLAALCGAAVGGKP